MFLKTTLSEALPIVHKRDIGRQFPGKDLSPYLKISVTNASFQASESAMMYKQIEEVRCVIDNINDFHEERIV